MTVRIFGIRNCDTMKKALALLEANTSAIKRPVVEWNDRLLVGFDPAEFENLA
jgi:arsenate reductase-like glutaredoxin family protein